jgi:hypothetical protein
LTINKRTFGCQPNRVFIGRGELNYVYDVVSDYGFSWAEVLLLLYVGTHLVKCPRQRQSIEVLVGVHSTARIRFVFIHGFCTSTALHSKNHRGRKQPSRYVLTHSTTGSITFYGTPERRNLHMNFESLFCTVAMIQRKPYGERSRVPRNVIVSRSAIVYADGQPAQEQ